MRRWPPIVWPGMTFASLLILMGLSPWDPLPLALGIGPAVATFAVAFVLARRRKGPWPAGFTWAMLGLAAVYAICAVFTAFAGRGYVVAGIGAALIPLTALLLLLGTVRAKTAGDTDEPLPGIGIDDQTPLGDTPEHPVAREGTPVRRR